MKKKYYIYIMTNKNNTTLYIRITNNLDRRYFEHHLKENPNSFTAKYNLNKLVYFEEYEYVNDAIHREKQLKCWHRQWKTNLITEFNPSWNDLNK